MARQGIIRYLQVRKAEGLQRAVKYLQIYLSSKRKLDGRSRAQENGSFCRQGHFAESDSLGSVMRRSLEKLGIECALQGYSDTSKKIVFPVAIDKSKYDLRFQFLKQWKLNL